MLTQKGDVSKSINNCERVLSKNQKTIGIILGAIAISAVAFFVLRPGLKPTDSNVEEKVAKQKPVDNSPVSAKITIETDTVPKVIDQAIKDAKLKIPPPEKTEKWANEKFETYLTETLSNLPNKTKLQKLSPDEIHYSPRMIMEAGARLGRIKRQLKLNANFVPSAMKFYTECASQNDGATPVRGLCLANLIHLKTKAGETVDKTKYPARVFELAEKAAKLSF